MSRPVQVKSTKWVVKGRQEEEVEDDYLPVRDMIDDTDSRKLKRYLIEINESADRIILKYKTTKPEVCFEYIVNGYKQIRPLREIIKANESLRKNKKLVKRIYDVLYRKVE